MPLGPDERKGAEESPIITNIFPVKETLAWKAFSRLWLSENASAED